MLTPMRLRTLGWLNLLATLHSVINSLTVSDDVNSVITKDTCNIAMYMFNDATFHSFDGYFNSFTIASIPAFVNHTKLSCMYR